MKKSWLAILLAPCLTFAAYPIYENDFADQDVAESQHSDVLQYGMAQNMAIEEEAVAYEDEAQEEEVLAIPQEPVRMRESASRSIQQKRMQRTSKETAYEDDAQDEEMVAAPQEPVRKKESSSPSVHQKRLQRSPKAIAPSAQRKQAAAASKRSPVKKNSSAQGNASPRSKVQESRQNSNRPRVTHRDQAQSRSQNQIEADAQPDAGSVYEEQEHMQSPKVRNQAAAPRKSALSQRSDKMVNRQSARSKNSSKGMKYQERSAKSHHPGHRPLAE
ncbi:MAG: hypothetical protein JSS60_03530 [Verrucomicrobia bacterium]|nr:hypothetical protein [Verrucomicrobiota bacterium]